MNKEALINKSMMSLRRLPKHKIVEILEFIDFLSLKHSDEKSIRNDINTIIQDTKSFSFLYKEEDLYSEKDLL